VGTIDRRGVSPALAAIATAIALALEIATSSPSAFTRQFPPPSVRFHHFHFRVPDPAASMNATAAAFNGTRVLLRGLGVGVRIGREYALFDRSDGTELQEPSLSAAAAYESAQQWLVDHGIRIEPDGSSRTELAAKLNHEAIDHVAFTSADTSIVVSALIAHGATPSRQTDESRFFRTGTAGIEIVRDVDAPDAFWCPMHPDIRSSTAGRCPLCRMELVRIPPPRLGEYWMDVAVTPGPAGRGASKLRLTLVDPVTRRPVSSFATIHERLVHLFIIGRQLDYFRHVHPVQLADGTFELRENIPPGEFMVIADFLPMNGRAQMLQRAIVSPGYHGSLFPSMPNLRPDAAWEKVDGGVRVRLEADGLKAGKEGTLKFTLTDAVTKASVTDLEPFLGAPGHMLLVNADLSDANHVHPEEPATRGPVITFQPMMPAPGLYKLWLQFQRHGIVTTVPFVVSVADP
jgi:heavy metal-binding protein